MSIPSTQLAALRFTPLDHSEENARSFMGRFVVRTKSVSYGFDSKGKLIQDFSFCDAPLKILIASDQALFSVKILGRYYDPFDGVVDIHQLGSVWNDSHWKLPDLEHHAMAYLYNRCKEIPATITTAKHRKVCTSHVWRLGSEDNNVAKALREISVSADAPFSSLYNQCKKDDCRQNVETLAALYERYGIATRGSSGLV